MSDAKLGLWKDDDLAATVSHNTGNRYYQALPDKVQFCHSVAKIIVMNSARDNSALYSAPSLFVLGPVPEGIPVVPKREPTFSLGGVNVAGKIWFGSPAMNSSNGFTIPPGGDADAIFTFLSETLASGRQPAIYFGGASNEFALRFYPEGVDKPDKCEDIQLGGAHLNEKNLKELLDRIHVRSLITPTACASAKDLWQNSAKCYPVERAEGAIQKIVEIGLAIACGNLQVKSEETGVFGRYDLAVIEQDPLDPSKKINYAILELKVVKSFTSSGNKVTDTANQKAVQKGIRQAFAYRKEHGSRFSALCCYDMRPTPTLHKYSKGKCKVAGKLDVEFWAWPLFSNTESARIWLVESHLAGAS